MVVVSREKGFDLRRQFRDFLGFVFESSQALASDSSVEGLDVTLLVLFVRTPILWGGACYGFADSSETRNVAGLPALSM